MRAIGHIRKHIFKKRQAEFAAMLGVAQSTVSRWERGDSSPTLEEMTAIRSEAARNGLEWDDAWFFEAPEVTA